MSDQERTPEEAAIHELQLAIDVYGDLLALWVEKHKTKRAPEFKAAAQRAKASLDEAVAEVARLLGLEKAGDKQP